LKKVATKVKDYITSWSFTYLLSFGLIPLNFSMKAKLKGAQDKNMIIPSKEEGTNGDNLYFRRWMGQIMPPTRIDFNIR
jgi:hypothetical protein